MLNVQKHQFCLCSKSVGNLKEHCHQAVFRLEVFV